MFGAGNLARAKFCVRDRQPREFFMALLDHHVAQFCQAFHGIPARFTPGIRAVFPFSIGREHVHFNDAIEFHGRYFWRSRIGFLPHGNCV